MSQQYLSEIRIMSFDFAPQGWAKCDGQTMSITQNSSLFGLIGTSFGGDGKNTFALPDMRGLAPVHASQTPVGVISGEPAHTLIISEIPSHTHNAFAVSTQSNTNIPAGNVLANSAPNNIYGPVQNLGAANTNTVSNTGNSQPHENMQPYLVLNFCIALQGIYPSQN